ncbi:MAG: hypothetical protein J5I98_26490 [Phaeodactylibacter sp.]|nr:hypothetical protein [Phaeodactylibacter sp.]
MKKLYGILYLFALLLSVHFLSFSPQLNYTGADALGQVKQQFDAGLESLATAIRNYQEQAGRFARQGDNLPELRQAHLDTRLAFKKIEFLLEYNDRESVKKHLNGPPLPTTEPKVPEVRIIEPTGLQVLDELAFGGAPEEERGQIETLVAQLAHDFAVVRAYQGGIPLQHRFIFEAARYELIRLYTLGLTGFDTPGSGNALPEAVAALQGVAQALNAYLPLIEEQDPALARQLQTALPQAVGYLRDNRDFDSFDRLYFLKKFLDPLLGLTLKAQQALQVELPEEASGLPQSVNYQAGSLFDNDFLNVHYFANHSPAELDKKRVALGRLLFFDPILSANNQRSCASCHQPGRAFTDGMDKSLALNGEGKIQRNAPTLINAIYSERFFYDLREPNLERQVKHVVLDHKEFGTDFLAIIDKLNQSSEYRALFAEAYSDNPRYQLSKWSVSDALACYVASLRSFNSPFDRYARGETENLSPQAAQGFNLFMGKASCGTCHFAPAFNGTVPPYYQESESEVLGVPADKDEENPKLDADPGRIASARPQDEAPFYAHSFKTVTVRNAALTAPYMHNGAYSSLEEVVDFYNKGGGLGLGLDVPYQTLPDTPLNLDEGEVDALVAFMESLTDTAGLTAVPERLPAFEDKPEWNERKVGGMY